MLPCFDIFSCPLCSWQKVLLHRVVEVRTQRAARENERIDDGEPDGCDEPDVKPSSKESLSAQLWNPNFVCDSTRAPWSRNLQI